MCGYRLVLVSIFVFFFKQKTAYEMRISDWSSDVCSSDLAVRELFVTSTHTPVLFFSTAGKVYRMKVWRLPEGAPQARGRPMVNLLPLAEGEAISTVLPLPEDEAEWKNLHVMFATANEIGRAHV